MPGSSKRARRFEGTYPNYLKYRRECLLPAGFSLGLIFDRLEDREVGIRVPVGSRIFSTSSRPALGPTPVSYPEVLGSIPGASKFSLETVGLERGPLSLVRTTEELLGRNSSGSGQENRD
jgi:hypothetical protein